MSSKSHYKPVSTGSCKHLYSDNKSDLNNSNTKMQETWKGRRNNYLFEILLRK